MLENKLPRKILGLEKEEVKLGRRKLYNEDSLPFIYRFLKSRTFGCAVRVTRRSRGTQNFDWET
jgi:hypothetical protein